MKLLLVIAILCASCAGPLRDTQLCDAEKLSAKALESLSVCQAQGLAWDDCPDRERLLAELKKELNACSH